MLVLVVLAFIVVHLLVLIVFVVWSVMVVVVLFGFDRKQSAGPIDPERQNRCAEVLCGNRR